MLKRYGYRCPHCGICFETDEMRANPCIECGGMTKRSWSKSEVALPIYHPTHSRKEASA